MTLSPQDVGPLQKSLSAHSLDIIFYFSGDSHVKVTSHALLVDSLPNDLSWNKRESPYLFPIALPTT